MKLSSLTVSAFLCFMATTMFAAAENRETIHATANVTKVELEGTLITELHYGPPGFGESPKIDKQVYPFILVLKNMIDIKWDSREREDDNSVKKVQLAFPYERVKEFKKFKNMTVIVKGRIYYWVVATQYTPVLISVESIKAKPSAGNSKR
jgi:hypothetical protein